MGGVEFPVHQHRAFQVGGGSLSLPTFTFAIAFSAKKHACGPEARALRGKSIGGKGIRSGDPPVLPQGEAGRSGAQPGAPTTQLPGPGEKNGLPARPRK